MTEWNNNYPPQPQPQAKRGPAWPWILLAVGVVLVLACGVAVVANAVGEPKDPGWTVGASREPGLGSPAPYDSSTPAPASTPAAPAGQIGEGTYEVGPEIAPGKYKSAGAKPSAFQFCGWSVKDSAGKTLEIGSASEETEQQLVTLKAGQVFDSSGCHTWVRVG